MEPSFRVYFNHRRQWVDVFMEDIHPDTFQERSGSRWGYFTGVGGDDRRGRRGLFGELHFVVKKFRHDTVAHELLHLWIEWIRTGRRRGEVREPAVIPYSKTEEKYCDLFDEITRHFWKEYEKWRVTKVILP